MKRIVNFLAAILLICSVSASLFACSGEYVKRTENELTYYLPQDFSEKNYEGIQVCYATPKATFILTVWSREQLASNWYITDDFDIIKLTEEFISLNEYEAENYEYDEARGVTTLHAYATEYYDSDDIDLFYNLLAVTEGYAYIVTLHCDEAVAEEHIELFEDILSRIEVK